ncbi:hypothetical protein PVAND_017680 [Polypedilum vanderplanki]|uniref:Uncharacterized protein n=1 Tax=Polypedilum vanderplanki TaxID=319348 RepID=A0A9J6B8X6_POLVA|nr:hypothetical protein PVAND_017680 [Polypedilum vanderplanki]
MQSDLSNNKIEMADGKETNTVNVNRKAKPKRLNPERFSIFVYKILKELHPNTEISRHAMAIMNCIIINRLSNLKEIDIITTREVQRAVLRGHTKKEQKRAVRSNQEEKRALRSTWSTSEQFGALGALWSIWNTSEQFGALGVLWSTSEHFRAIFFCLIIMDIISNRFGIILIIFWCFKVIFCHVL